VQLPRNYNVPYDADYRRERLLVEVRRGVRELAGP
jgi:hypothetical protein